MRICLLAIPGIIKNVYGGNECLWHFNTIAGLIKHSQDTHDDRHFACTTCGEVFASNPNLCRHTKSHHIKLCHLCCKILVSDDKLFDHMKEIHWEVLMLVDSEAAARVSSSAETVDYFG